MPETQYKICPRCQTHADLAAAVCANCGRKFNTQFAPPAPAPEPMTQVYQTPALRPTPPPVAPIPNYYTPPQAYAPPALNADLAMTEYSRQFRWMNWILVLGVLFVGGLIGIAMIIYALVQKSALRQKVLEQGIDPSDWARPMDMAAIKHFLYILGGCFAFGVVFAGCLTLTQTPAP